VAAAASLAWASPRPALANPAGAGAQPEHQAFFQQAARCTAVLKTQVTSMQARSAKGEANLRPEMVRLAELSFAFVGRAYLRGLRKPLADQLLSAAEMQQRSLSAPALAALSAECQAQGAQVLNDANFVERALVRNRAAARVDKLLAPEPAADAMREPASAPQPRPKAAPAG
jgi:hypothetical protein